MFLLSVEDTVDVKQWRTKGQKNNENNENDIAIGLWGGVLLRRVLCLAFYTKKEQLFQSKKLRRQKETITGLPI